MAQWIQGGPAFAAAFLSCLVELVEALTIVLAAGITRGWRSALLGALAAAGALAALIVVLGPAVQRIELKGLQLAIGVLLLLFGMRWARKAILRSAGLVALHDEAAEFAKEERILGQLARSRGTLDWAGFGASFQGVLVEGLEVVFIVIAVGGAARSLAAAAAGATAAAVLVLALGLVVHRPLTRVPENALKFLVSVMISSFGTFWIGEGISLRWPGGEWALLLLMLAYLAVFGLAVQWARRRSALAVPAIR
jgi:Ca2+/H+ antiporter, TMEM165/GDT1 family